ncbi:DUF2760 domain-containing protein [Criblamydia sequanensis]|uniref:DUF2760 domain-containing protein n=1 Tax=Candidatus Criblamydia sequanensis CRIB-18 TaxID=1437425 RepID=A0A090D218_9BACT|nr:DUF2760 domain-containing protein [Criblamydia sequanensis]CDR33988.1 Conserved hypothetical protein [Criblamydia sequanensis CRIB-18]
MRIFIAIKAFLKALRYPEKAQLFLDEKASPPKEKAPKETAHHIQLLSLLQQSGRLIDFLEEDLSAFSDDQVGLAVREIHKECKKALDEHVLVKPLREENEGTLVDIMPGYDAAEIKLIGNLKKEPPFQGVIRHKGWIATKHSLPKRVGTGSFVIQPAEIEIR